jgi:predicted ATPase
MRHRGKSYTTESHGGSKRKEGRLLSLYHQKVKNGSLRYDKCQENTISRLDPLSSTIVEYEEQYLAKGFPAKIVMPTAVHKDKKSSSMWSRMKNMVSSITPTEEIERIYAPKGFYMYGDVGSGKTMLMDLFLEGTPVQFKQRVHFNSFMIDFHNSLHHWRQTPQAKGMAQSAAIESIADSILIKSPLLCFDEFQVTNIADAMILNRLFHTLWYKGAVVIATSNRVPEDLYKGGLQRENFVPFIHELNGKCIIHDIGSTIDYRLMGERTNHIWNEKSKNPHAISEIWDSLTESRPGEKSELSLMSRKILVPKSIKGIAMFDFHELCARPLGSADYGLLAREFHTLFITDIPVLSLEQKDLVRRFITLVDELYEHRVKVICSADAEMSKIFPYTLDTSSKGSSSTLIAGEEEIFAFSRTLSRLSEMQTTEYLQSHHLKDPSIRDKV